MRLLVTLLVLALATPALAAPTISSTSGAWAHKGTVTISGSEFGTKDPAAPWLWDACDADSTNDLATHWPTDTFPKPCSGTPGEYPFEMAYRSSFHDFDEMPHSRITKFLCAAATTCNGAWSAGGSEWANNIVTSDLTFNSNTFWATWYYRVAPTFNDTAAAPGDNMKEWNANSDNCGNPGSAYCGLTAYVDWCNSHVPPGVDPLNARMRGTGSSGCSTGQFCDTPNPMQGWIHAEMDWTTAGYLFGYSNGSTVGTAGGRCTVPINRADGSPPVSITMGGFTRWPITGGATGNYRFWAAIYIDKTYSRVMLGNASTWAASTIREPQIPSAWAADSITATVNLGALSGETAYLYVFDSANTPSTGYAVTIGTAEAECAVETQETDCDDGNACTTDTCVDSACAHANNTADCDDGIYCNGADTCAAGVCTHAGDPCAGGAACNTQCNEDTNDCFNDACSDGAAGEICDGAGNSGNICANGVRTTDLTFNCVGDESGSITNSTFRAKLTLNGECGDWTITGNTWNDTPRGTLVLYVDLTDLGAGTTISNNTFTGPPTDTSNNWSAVAVYAQPMGAGEDVTWSNNVATDWQGNAFLFEGDNATVSGITGDGNQAINCGGGAWFLDVAADPASSWANFTAVNSDYEINDRHMEGYDGGLCVIDELSSTVGGCVYGDPGCSREAGNVTVTGANCGGGEVDVKPSSPGQVRIGRGGTGKMRMQ